MASSITRDPPKFFAIALTLLGLFLFLEFVCFSLPSVLSGETVSDFPNYYFAGLRILEGRELYYDFAEEVRATLVGNYQVYPADTPFTLVTLAPLAQASYVTAGAILIVISVSLVLAITYAVSRCSGWNRITSVMFAALTLGSMPMLFMLLRNHMEALVMLPLYLGWQALRSHRNIIGGALWGLAAALKLFPLLLLVFLIRSDRKSALVSATSVFVLASLLGFAVIGFSDSQIFLLDILARGKIWLGVVGNYSVLSLLTALNLPIVGAIFMVVLSIVAVWILVDRRTDIDTAFGVGVCAALLISPLSWLNYLILVLPLLILLPQRVKIDTKLALGGYLLLSVILAFTPGFIELGSGYFQILINHLPTFGLMVLGGWWWKGLRNSPTLFPNYPSGVDL